MDGGNVFSVVKYDYVDEERMDDLKTQWESWDKDSENKVGIQEVLSGCSGKLISKANATLKGGTKYNGTEPGSSKPPGYSPVKFPGKCPTHHQKGHLIAASLGGNGSDKENLVTLTGGSNHPIMYEFEKKVHDYILTEEAAGKSFTYSVECVYDPQAYTRTEFPKFKGYPAAAGNPFCLFPAPAKLKLSLSTGGECVTKKVLDLSLLSEAGIESLVEQQAEDGALLILNGVYKRPGTSHTQDCWAMTNQLEGPVLKDATDYAKDSGYKV
jgi:hypothetical protein